MSGTCDDRSRLETTVLLRSTINPVPRSQTLMRDADFVESREMVPLRLGEAEVNLLGVAAARAVVPATWVADPPAPANQITKRTFSMAGVPAGEELFTFAGGRRETAGPWKYTYDLRDRLTSVENAIDGRRISYEYDPNDRLVGRLAEQKDTSGAWVLETRTNVLARDALPATTTFVWDPVVDRLIALFDSSVVRSQSSTSTNPELGLIRQIIHGDQGYDDPTEVLVALAAGQNPTRYLPIIDTAAGGSLQAIAREDGTLVERVLYADSSGDTPRYLHGAVVERLAVTRTPADIRKITIDLTEAIDPATLNTGVRITAIDATEAVRVATAAPTLIGDRSIEISFDSAAWAALVTDAQSVEIALSSSLRFPAWGATPLQAVAAGEVTLGRALSPAAQYPFQKSLAVAQFDTTATLYDVADLYLVASPNSKAALLFDFKAAPYRDPATSLVYLRARWLDPSTSSFLTADPAGMTDSSNAYAFASNNPMAMHDPTGQVALVDNAIGGLVSVAIGWGMHALTAPPGDKYTLSDAAVDFGVGFLTSGLSSVSKIGKLGKLGTWALKEAVEVGLDTAATIAKARPGDEITPGSLAAGAAKNWAIGRAGAIVGKRSMMLLSSVRRNRAPASSNDGSRIVTRRPLESSRSSAFSIRSTPAEPGASARLIRIDVLDVNANVAYDYKFVMPWLRTGMLSRRQLSMIWTHGPRGVAVAAPIYP